MTFLATLPPALVAGAVMALGAALVLLFAGPLSSRVTLTTAIGTVAALGAVLAVLALSPEFPVSVVALCTLAALTLLLVPWLDLQDEKHAVECTALILLGTCGAVALATATDMLQAVVGLETLALSSVVLVALGRGTRALEASFKYLVLGAVSASGLLYGVGLVYLGTGSFAFPTAAQIGANPLVLAGVVLVGLGIAFELAIVPFHWGALDAYTAADPALAGFVMVASKLAAAFALGTLVSQAGLPVAQVLVWIGVATIVWGTLGALVQRGLRRLLAYSAVTHAGFIALAVGSGAAGPATAAFYAVVYGAMAMLAFAAIAGRPRPLLAGDGVDADMPTAEPRDIEIASLRTGWLGPLRTGALAFALLCLSGIPPTPGFWAKLSVLMAAWEGAGLFATLVAVAGGVFSVLYYLRPVPDLFAALRTAAPVRGPAGAPAVPAIFVATALVVVFGVFPGLVWWVVAPIGARLLGS